MAWLILIIAMLGWSAPGFAQTKTSDKEWNAVVEAAKKEGKVVVAGSPDPVMRNDVIPKFKERYGIPVEFIAGRSSEITARVKTERGSGIYSVDVFLAGPDTTATTLYGEKLIDPLKPLLIMPEVTDATKWKQGKIWFADPEERFVARAFSSVATLLFINTDQVKPEEMRTAKDLLNAKWRGKISTEDPTTTGSGANSAARFYHDFGEDFVRKLYIEQKAVRTRDRRQMSDWLARGTQPICLSCREDDVRPLIKDGFKILEIFSTRRYACVGQRFAVDADSREQGAQSESSATFRQLDSIQRGARHLCARLRLRQPAHGCRRSESQPRQFTEEGR